MVQWVIGSIPHGGPIDFFHSSQCSTTGVTKAWYVLFCLWDDAYKRFLAANQRVAHVAAAGFFSIAECSFTIYPPYHHICVVCH